MKLLHKQFRRKDVIGMKKPEANYVRVFDKILSCPFCENRQFWYRTTLMNTAGMTFMGWDWMNDEAENFICSKCGYVQWFFGTPRDAIRKSSKESTLHKDRKVLKKDEKGKKEDGWWLKVKTDQ